jgi:hypothetical protein
MTIRIPVRSLFLLACGVLLGVAVDRVGTTGAIVPVVAAQQARGPAPPPTLALTPTSCMKSCEDTSESTTSRTTAAPT